MRNIISFMHISLDGFVSGPKGEMNWIKVDEEIFDHVGKRISKCDTALYGRVTFEMMENYWPTAADKPTASKHDIEHSRWYSKAHKIVLSRTMKEDNLANTKIIGDNLSARINEIKQQEGTEILLFGSPTATHSLLKENLIDGFWLFVNPVVLGKGVRLFEDNRKKINLKRIPPDKSFNSGVIELNYLIDRE